MTVQEKDAYDTEHGIGLSTSVDPRTVYHDVDDGFAAAGAAVVEDMWLSAGVDAGLVEMKPDWIPPDSDLPFLPGSALSDIRQADLNAAGLEHIRIAHWKEHGLSIKGMLPSGLAWDGQILDREAVSKMMSDYRTSMFKVGCRTGLTFGAVCAVGAWHVNDGHAHAWPQELKRHPSVKSKIALVSAMKAKSPFADMGDSGSLVFCLPSAQPLDGRTPTECYALGLLNGMISVETGLVYTLCTPVAHIQDLLQVTLCTIENP
jgi:hypothetical protein